MMLAVLPAQVPALSEALARDRDCFVAVASLPDQLEEDRVEAIRCVDLAAGWLFEMPALHVPDDHAAGYLAGILEDGAGSALSARRFAEAGHLIALRAELDLPGVV